MSSYIRTDPAEYPVGDPFGGPAYGKREDPIFTPAVMASMTAAAPWVAGSMVLSNLMGPKTKTPAAPAVEKPTLMPDPLAQQEAMRKKASIMQSQSMGRASTVLTPTTEKLGG